MRGTLKITSAMKMIASSKLHKAQQAVAGMIRYRDAMDSIVAALPDGALRGASASVAANPDAPVALVAFSSNSSLCGAFNSNVIRAALKELSDNPGAQVYAAGRKMSDALKRSGYALAAEWSAMTGGTGYDAAASLASQLFQAFREGRCSKVLLVYSHFVSATQQVPLVEQLLPFVPSAASEGGMSPEEKYIFEPEPSALASLLVPQLVSLKFYFALLDSYAAECAARTLAMQVASDNAQALLGELTLEYNKKRQDKITSEILDLVGGSMQ